MVFNEQLPEWHATGVEPPESKKNQGWQPDDKPPADWFNWLFNRIYKVLVEIRNTLSGHVENPAPHSGHETPDGATQKANAALTEAKGYTDGHAEKKDTHGAGSGYYLAKTSRQDQLPAWEDVQGKPSSYQPSAHQHTKSDISDFPISMTPSAHKTTHASGGSDALTPADIGAETPAGAQAKATAAASAALAAANDYTDQEVGEVAGDLASHLADTVPHGIGDKSTLLTTEKSTIVGAINELFTDVSNGKTSIASAIADMGQLAAGSDTFAQLAAKIRDISKDATAGVGDVLAGKTFYQGGVKRTGTIPSKGAATITPGTANQVISAGQYLSGAQTILGSPNLLSENIKRGVDIFGVNGILDYGPYLRPYDLGIENIAIVNGYSQDVTGSGSVTKESNRIKFYYSGVGERSVVTDTTINLTNIKYILVDWEISGSYQPTLYLVASTTKIAGGGTSNAYVMVYDYARNFSILDVSSLSGYFYIRVHLISVNALGSGTGYLHRILLV